MYKLIVMRCIIVFIASLMVLGAQAQQNHLTPYRVKGRMHPLSFNLQFGAYKTEGIRRTIGSLFAFGTPNLLNGIAQVDGIPFYRKERLRAKDVFRFSLLHNKNDIASVETRAFMLKNETYTIWKPFDSSFMGANNTDILEARIMLHSDTTQVWQAVFNNLHGTKEEDTRGLLRKDSTTIEVMMQPLLLKIKQGNDIQDLLATVELVYAFRYNNKYIAAISVKEEERKFWIDEQLPANWQHLIASAAVILTVRRNLYP